MVVKKAWKTHEMDGFDKLKLLVGVRREVVET